MRDAESADGVPNADGSLLRKCGVRIRHDDGKFLAPIPRHGIRASATAGLQG